MRGSKGKHNTDEPYESLRALGTGFHLLRFNCYRWILSLALCAQWYSHISWERFKALHGCESTIYLNESSWEPVETAWTCDDGKAYFR